MPLPWPMTTSCICPVVGRPVHRALARGPALGAHSPADAVVNERALVPDVHVAGTRAERVVLAVVAVGQGSVAAGHRHVDGNLAHAPGGGSGQTSWWS